MEYWFNLNTRQVEEGPRSDYSQLMGPYSSREDAQRALQTAAENTQRWDENERRYLGDD
ncbi:SPOR domain-containing protein [Kocuria sp. JC486]|uniref:SPOR domain-containing protein n=1 Tax=Kocuria soli TaxID=2485125 RepID=A0A3N4ADC4_9MICC|nr:MULTISPECIES: SPOR domain-containing protein [Kocuria]NHU84394.1 SPOR domain-containing protein [Kocuria sp. JC486]ROZ63978.1 SPOR domain-containing protein [Kocuria soli]